MKTTGSLAAAILALIKLQGASARRQPIGPWGQLSTSTTQGELGQYTPLAGQYDPPGVPTQTMGQYTAPAGQYTQSAGQYTPLASTDGGLALQSTDDGLLPQQTTDLGGIGGEPTGIVGGASATDIVGGASVTDVVGASATEIVGGASATDIVGGASAADIVGGASATVGGGTATGVDTAPSATASSGNGQICINWEGDFHWLMQGGFGSDAGSGGADASRCWDTSVTGAAMFICESECNGSGDAAPAKYTKFECTLSTGFPNCDMSLVDGFSLPAACTFESSAGQVTIGGTQNLWDLASCDSPGGDNTCYNAQGYSSDISQLSPFFQNAYNDQNNYCNWQTCPEKSDPAWSSTTFPTISCTVGAGKSKRSIPEHNTAPEQKRYISEPLESRNLHGLAERAVHGGARIHARGLKSHM